MYLRGKGREGGRGEKEEEVVKEPGNSGGGDYYSKLLQFNSYYNSINHVNQSESRIGQPCVQLR